MTVLKACDIPFVDFVAREEIIGAKEYLTLYIELREDMQGEEVRSRIHTELMNFDKDWRDLSTFFEYIPLEIRFLSQGTFNKYLEGKDGMARITRVGMREERFSQLLSFSESDPS